MNHSFPYFSTTTLMRIIFALAATLMLGINSSAIAATKTWNQTAGGAWTTAGNWTPSGAPAAGDAVIISGDQSGNITAVPTISLLSLTANGTCRLAAATSGNTLTITGTLAVASAETLSLGVSGGRLNFTLANTATGSVNGTAVLNFDGGTTVRTFLVNGNLTIAPGAVLTDLAASAGSAFTLSSGATLQIGSAAGITTTGATGAIQVTGTRTYSAGANYVYNGTASQSTGNGLGQNNPANVTINNSAGVILSQNMTITGGLNVTAGIFTVGAFTVSIGGATTVSGTLLHNSTTGTKTYTGNVTINSGGTWSETANEDFAFAGNLQNDGTFTAGTGAHTFSGTAKTISGANPISIPSVTISGTTTNTGILTVSTTLAGNGTLTNGANATLNYGGATIPNPFTLTATASGNTVNYNGAAQTAKATTYNNLTLSGSGAKTTTGVTVNGKLSMQGNGTVTASAVPTYGANATLEYNAGAAQSTGVEFPATWNGTGGVIIANTSGNVTLNAAKVVNAALTINSAAIMATGNFSLTFGGDFFGFGTLNAGSSPIIITGTAAQSIDGFTTIGSVSVTKTGGTATLADNVSCSSLTLTSGVLSTDVYKISITSSAAGAVSITSGSVNGEVERSIAAGSTGTYMFTNLNTQLIPNGSQGAITASIRSFPNTTPPGIGAGSAITRYYAISPSGALTATIRLSYLDAEINGVPEASMSLFRYTGTAWTPAVSIPNVANNYVEAPGVSTFSNWTIGDADHPLPIQLVSFTGTSLNNGNVRLDWATVSEVSNYGFHVERKRPSEQTFIEVPNSFVPGHGTTNEPQSYAFTDLAPGQGSWMYRLRQQDLDGSVTFVEPITVDIATSVIESNGPAVFDLKQNYPNPFNPTTSIQYSVDKTEHVRLRVFDTIGREVAVLADNVMTPGLHSLSWDASGASAGVYFYRIETSTRSETRRMILLK